MSIRKHIPNSLTSLNLFSGCLGIVAVFEDNLPLAALLMAVAIVFDYADGMAARLLHAKSDIGLQLDSLSDVVSFGVLPGFIVMKMMEKCSSLPDCAVSGINLCPFIALIIPVFSALRLAKFNIDTRQTDSFLGLPTPANAIFFGSLPLVIQQCNDNAWTGLAGWLSNWGILTGLTLIFSGLLVSEIPLMSFKFKNLSWQSNKFRFIFLAIALLVLVFLKFAGIPVAILLYIMVSLISGKQKSDNGHVSPVIKAGGKN